MGIYSISNYFQFWLSPFPRWYSYENWVKITWKMNFVTLKSLYLAPIEYFTFLTLALTPGASVQPTLTQDKTDIKVNLASTKAVEMMNAFPIIFSSFCFFPFSKCRRYENWVKITLTMNSVILRTLYLMVVYYTLEYYWPWLLPVVPQLSS